MPIDGACSTARCHASAWEDARASILFSPLVQVTNQTGPSSVNRRTSPTDQPEACSKAKDSSVEC
jgi:hypothetical protein